LYSRRWREPVTTRDTGQDARGEGQDAGRQDAGGEGQKRKEAYEISGTGTAIAAATPGTVRKVFYQEVFQGAAVHAHLSRFQLRLRRKGEKDACLPSIAPIAPIATGTARVRREVQPAQEESRIPGIRLRLRRQACLPLIV